jgi:integrase
MATSALDVGDRVARQALVEKPEYVPSDDDLDAIFGISSTPSPEVVTLRSQYFVWMDELKTRAYDKPSPATLATFTSRAKTVLSLAGNIPLATFGNAAMKKFVQDCAHFNWSPSTLSDHVLLVKLILASAVNEEGDCLHPRTWNRRFVNAPAVETAKQKRFVFTRDQIEALLRAKSPQERLFYAVSAGTGMRLGEMRSIRVRGNNSQTSWEPGKIIVRTTMFNNDETGRTKTESGKRTVYLHSSLDQMIASFAKDIESGAFLFQSKHGEPMKASTIAYRITKIVPGGSHHGFRRYHISHCRHERMLEELLKLRVGHSSASDITDLYSHQSQEVQALAAEQVGLGFNLFHSMQQCA